MHDADARGRALALAALLRLSDEWSLAGERGGRAAREVLGVLRYRRQQMRLNRERGGGGWHDGRAGIVTGIVITWIMVKGGA